MMSWVSNTSSPSSVKTVTWCNTCRTSTQRTDTLTDRTSSPSSTQCIQSMWAIWLLTPTAPGLRRMARPKSMTRWSSMKSGWRNSRACRLYPVSQIQILTVTESRGRVLHLLKESTKPVPKQKKRRTIEALSFRPNMFSKPAIPSQLMPSNAPDKHGGSEETKDPIRSKRNKTPINSLLWLKRSLQ